MAENGTNVTRRTLLQWSGGLAAFFAAAGACGGQLAPWNASHSELSELTAESFLPFEGQTLVFSRPVPKGSILSRTVELKLVKVDRHETGYARRSAKRRAVSASARVRHSRSSWNSRAVSPSVMDCTAWCIAISQDTNCF